MQMPRIHRVRHRVRHKTPEVNDFLGTPFGAPRLYRSGKPNRHLTLRQQWMAASRNFGWRSSVPAGAASLCGSSSSHTVSGRCAFSAAVACPIRRSVTTRLLGRVVQRSRSITPTRVHRKLANRVVARACSSGDMFSRSSRMAASMAMANSLLPCNVRLAR